MANDYLVTTNGLSGTPAAATSLPAVNWAVAAGTAQAITAAYLPANTVLTDGLILGFRALLANTAAAPTFAPDGLTAYPIVRAGGVALKAGDIRGALQEALVRFNLANTRWELLNPASNNLQLELFKMLSADDTGGQNVNTAQPWFPTAGGVTVTASTLYRMEGQLWLVRAAGTTSHTTSLLFGGTATLTSIDYLADVSSGDTANQSADALTWGNVATAVAVKGADTSATENILVQLSGVVRINAGGTFIPQFQYSAAPGGAPTVKRNSFFRLVPLGDAAGVNNGTWA